MKWILIIIAVVLVVWFLRAQAVKFSYGFPQNAEVYPGPPSSAY